MNLELLDPFGRQVPDRVDATIQLPDILHYPPSHQQQQLQSPQQQPLVSSTTTASKKVKPSKRKNIEYDDEEEEIDDDDDEEEDDDDEMEDDDLEETSKVKRRAKTKQTSQQNSKNRRRLPSEKVHASNSGIYSKTDTNINYSEKNDINDNDEWKAAYHLSYNRRGNYLAVGYGSGTVAVFCTLTRTLTALYYADQSNSITTTTTTSSNRNSDSPLSHNSTKLKSSSHSTTNTSNKSKNTKSTTTNSLSNSSSNVSTGCSSLSWARRSRRLLIGNYNDVRARIIDTTHPIGAEDCAIAAATIVSYGQTAAAAAAATSSNPDDVDNDSTTGEVKESRTKPSKESIPLMPRQTPMSGSFSSSMPTDVIPPVYPYRKTASIPFADNEEDKKYSFARKTLSLSTEIIQPHDVTRSTVTNISSEMVNDPAINAKTSETNQKKNSSATAPKTIIRYPCVAFNFEHPVVGSLQIHPRYPNSGIAVLSDGSLVFFCIPFQPSAPFVSTNGITHKDRIEDKNAICATSVNNDGARCNNPAKIYPIYTKDNVSCASFDSLGHRIYAVTKSGTILGFDIATSWIVQLRNDKSYDVATQHHIPLLEPTVVIPRIFGNKSGDTASSSSLTAVWHLIVSRNGKFLIVNSSDGTIRLYNTMECWNPTTTIRNDTESTDTIIKPTWIFQDVVTKVKFASCDLSGDGEYVVGGANGADNKYELHIWNTSTGALMDKLTGASTKLYSVAWHPTRSFLAVACSDGLVDVWGPRINWTAFAPDFQALPMNVEYIEREDEFDLDENGRHLAEGYYTPNEMSESIDTNTPINVTKIERVPVFASDSEEEEEVFEFEIRVKNLFAGRVVETKSSIKKGVVDE